jgi:sugar lactone lactonase YvrE
MDEERNADGPRAGAVAPFPLPSLAARLRLAALLPFAARAPFAVLLPLAALLPSVALPPAAAKAAVEPPRTLEIPGERVFPESLTSTPDGTVIVGGLGSRTIYRAPPGASRAEPWIPPGTNGMEAIAGVLADARSGTLWACTARIDLAAGTPPAASALLAFDLATGAPRQRYPLPEPDSFCNDVAIGADGTVYATDSTHMNVLRLAPGGTRLEPWAGGGAFGNPGEILDGIAILRGRVYVNVYRTGRLYAIEVARDGRAGRIAAIALDRALAMPDGMRPLGPSSLLVAEAGGGGRLSRVDMRGDRASVLTLADGLADGPAAVTVVGGAALVLEAQFARLAERPGAATPPRPFRATAVALPRH